MIKSTFLRFSYCSFNMVSTFYSEFCILILDFRKSMGRWRYHRLAIPSALTLPVFMCKNNLLWGLAFATAPQYLLREHLVFSLLLLLFSFFHSYFFFLSLFSLIFDSNHCYTYTHIFLVIILLELIFSSRFSILLIVSDKYRS